MKSKALFMYASAHQEFYSMRVSRLSIARRSGASRTALVIAANDYTYSLACADKTPSVTFFGASREDNFRALM